ncbi:D-alanine--D-alanine ligase [Lentimicrobium sp.]
MKKNILLLTGGYSKEYAISVETGKVVARYLDPGLYNVYAIEVTSGQWFYTDVHGNKHTIDRNDLSLTLEGKKITFDAAFIAIHGTPGEDGILQGYLDMMHIPYNTCGHTTAALTFNKFFTNEVVQSAGLNVARTVYLHQRDFYNVNDILSVTGLPCFVKPNSNGSSVGMSKVKNSESLEPAIQAAFLTDSEVLIQEYIEGMEVTCGIYEKNGKAVILPLTEVVPHNEFFDYEAKYTSGKADEISPARISDELTTECKQLSLRLYRQLNCRGIVRFDYILKDMSKFYFLEANTIPGLSEASIVPKQAAAMGLSLKEFFTDLINETLLNH